jgi:tRNA threonylcarbamoyladenosine biosynthesis protein TsaE
MNRNADRTVETRNAEQTEALGRALGENARAGLYLALTGELGGGKTTFVRGLAAGLGAAGRVASPTFVIMREYRGRLPLFHCDFYRLEYGGDITELELEDCLEQGVVAAEWADLFEPPQGAHVLSLHFEWTGEETRRITLKAHCPAAVKLLAQLNMKFP